MTAKLYGFDRSFLHDTTERDPFVIDMVRADDYLKLEAKIAALQEQLSRYSMSAGQADQRKAESDSVRVALGFTADADDVSPSDLLEKIAALQEQVRALAAENIEMKKFCKNAAFDADYEAELGMDRGGFTDALNGIKTPATDAALREIRAQAVEGFSEFCGDNSVFIQATCNYDSLTDAACIYLARISAGDKP